MNKNIFFTLITLLIIIIAANFLNIFPIIYAKNNTPKDMVFSGQASWFDPWDVNLYASAIHSGQINGFLLPNYYTTIPNQPILMYPLYTTLGMIFKNSNPFLIFHTFAFIFGSVFIILIYFLLKVFLDTKKELFFALFAICLGGGLGFLLYPNIQSADVTMTSFTFLSAFQRPHEAVGIASYILALILFYKNLSKEEKKIDFSLLLIQLIILLLTVIFYPYYALSFFLISGLFLFVVNKAKLKISLYRNLFYLFVPIILSIILITQQSSINPTFSGVFTQNLPTPNPLFIFSGYGILIMLLIYELIFIKKNHNLLFLNTWFFISFFLAFLPLGFSRFYLRGLFFPLVVIGIIVLKDIAKKLKFNYFFLLTVFLVIFILSTLKITYKRIIEVKNNNHWYYLANDEYQGIEFLKNNSKHSQGVITLYRLGNLIPAYTNNMVYFGHLIQTPNSSQKLQDLYLFYTCQLSENQAKEFIVKNAITYILWGEEEKEINKNYLKRNISLKNCYHFLDPIFTKTNLTIFTLEKG